MTTTARTVGWPALWRAGGVAAVVAAVLNAILYFAAAAFGAMPQSVLTPAGQPITLLPVVLFSLVPPLLATLFYGLLLRFTRHAATVLVALVAVVYVLFFFAPLNLPGAPLGMIVTLELMHLVVAGLSVWLLLGTRRAP